MTYSKIYGFTKYLLLAIGFSILCLGGIGGMIALLCIKGLSWYLAILIVFFLYFVFSCFYLYKLLFRNFKDEVKQDGKMIETQIFYEMNTNYPYIKVDGVHIPLLGLYPKKLWEKFPEQSKITAFLPNEKKTAILVKQ